MTPTTFETVYQSLKRQDTRDEIQRLLRNNQASNGDKKSIEAFIDDLSQWLPSHEAGGATGMAKYRALLQGKKLKKGR